jgi:hypothetical protein
LRNFVLLTIFTLDVTNDKFANAYKTRTPIEMEILPLLWAMILVWTWYKNERQLHDVLPVDDIHVGILS